MREKIDFQDEVAIVTGSATGIGRGIAREFGREGATVVVADINEDRGSQTADEIEDESDVEAVFTHTDVSDYDACEQTIEETVETFGGVDVLVNVAAGGVGDPANISKPFVEETPGDWDVQTDVTFSGVLNTTHNILPHMIDGDGGAIVNIVSDSYQGHDENLTVYGAAKAGVATFTKSLALEVGQYDVRVNGVSPSTTWTGATENFLENYGDKIVENYPLGRLGQPEDHANAVVFLSSDAADWITGQILSVNGGYL